MTGTCYTSVQSVFAPIDISTKVKSDMTYSNYRSSTFRVSSVRVEVLRHFWSEEKKNFRSIQFTWRTRSNKFDTWPGTAHASGFKTLPRLSGSELTEHGVYIDVVEISDTMAERRLYVGSATGQFGIIQRWYTYLGSCDDGTYHSKEIRKPGRTTNLRCKAHYGFNLISGS
jgi:hypothetical protein